MTYELKHKNSTTSLELESGRYHYKFTPETPYEELKFVHDGQIGDWHFSQVMLNRGDFEQYAENTNTESMLGTAFSHIEKLQSFVTDENGQLTRSVEEGMNYTLRKYIDIIEGVDSETLDTAHGVYRTIQNYATKETSRFILDDSNFLVNLNKALVDDDGEIREEMAVIHATYDNLSLGLFGEDGMISGFGAIQGGALIKGDIIRLEGTTVMDDAFVDELMAKQIFTTRLVALTGTFGDLIANNLDVNNLTGNKAQFLDALFQAKDSVLQINGNQVDITTQVGAQTRFIRLNYHGLELRRGQIKMGHLGSAQTSSIFLGANTGHKVSIGYQGTNTTTSNLYDTAIQVDGTTGLITFDNHINISGYNIQNSFGGFSIASTSGGWALQGKNGTNIYMYNTGNVGLGMSNNRVYRVDQIYDDIGTANSNITTVNNRLTSIRDNLQAQINALK